MRHRLHAAADADLDVAGADRLVEDAPTARTPEAQTLLIVSEETSFGMPALICAWREGIWPWPAWSTWPMTRARPARARRRRARARPRSRSPPSSVASSDDRPPPILPIGVRAAPRMTVLGMRISPSRSVEDDAWPRAVMRDAPRVARRRCASPPPPTPPATTDADTVVVGVFEGEDVAHDVEGGALQAPAGLAARRGARSSTLALAHAEGKRWLLVGLGARDAFDAERARVAAAVALGRARELGARSLCWELPAPRRRRRRRGARRGHAARRLPLRPLQAAPPEDAPARLERARARATTTTWREAVGDAAGRRRGAERARATCRTARPTT